jgi:hypothetical protein
MTSPSAPTMTPTAPPATTERLLEGLSGDTQFARDMIGDLAEEFSRRAESEGPVAAARAYRLEALRAVPYLAFDWLRSTRGPGIRHLANVVALSMVCTLILGFFIQLLAFALVVGLGKVVGTESALLKLSLSGFAVLSLVANLAIGMVSGALAAWFSREAHLLSAVSMGFVWVTLAATINLIVGTGPIPAFVRVIAMALMFTATCVGGALYVRAAGEARAGA